MAAGDFAFERDHRGNVGLFSVSGRCRSVGRNQFAVAVVRDCESIAGFRGAGCGHDDFAENETPAMDMGDAGTHDMAGCGDDDGELSEDF